MTTDCIFQTDWWLDAAAPNSWNAIEIEKNGEIVARLPLMKFIQKLARIQS
jgi:hypothetical protein